MSLSLQILSLPDGETVPRREIVVASCPFVIGRDFDCDLRLPDSTTTLSRRHLQFDGDRMAGYRASDLSTNGAKLNGTDMPRQTPRAVADGDILEFAGYRLLVSVTTRPVLPQDSADPQSAPQSEERQMPLSELESGDGTRLEADDPAEGPFGSEVDALDANLLFDPFEDGPGLRNAAQPEPPQDQLTSAMDQAAIMPDLGLPVASAERYVPIGVTPAAMRDIGPPLLEREELSDAIDRAVSRFMDHFDPIELEKEYRDFLGPLARTRRRYWNLFHKQFRRRRDNGDYGRAFRAILAEEVRRK